MDWKIKIGIWLSEYGVSKHQLKLIKTLLIVFSNLISRGSNNHSKHSLCFKTRQNCVSKHQNRLQLCCNKKWCFETLFFYSVYIYIYISAGIFEFYSDRKARSHIVDARPTHWKLIIFCKSVCRASVVRQHSLLARGGRCTNATHIFVRPVIVKGSWVCLKYWTHMNA